MTEKVKLKEIYEVEKTLDPFYTGGNVQWSEDGKHLFCICNGVFKVLQVDIGIVIRSIGDEEDKVMSFSLGVGEFMHILITNHKSELLKAWNWLDGSLERQWKHTHKGPISNLRVRPYSVKSPRPEITLVTTGSDCLRLWDISHGQCTHALRDKDFQGATSVVEWAESENDCEIWASAFDYKIYIWSIINGEKIAALEGHFSSVIGIVFHPDGLHAISVGRDKIFILWDRVNKLSLRNFAVPDCPSGLILLPSLQSNDSNVQLDNNGIYIMISSDKGFIRLMDAQRGCEIMSQSVENTVLVGLLSCKSTGQIAYITSDHIIGIQDYFNPETIKLFIGFNDELIDLTLLGKEESLLAVASNSQDIKVYLREDMSCWLLRGHKDHVLSLSSSPVNYSLLASSSKDNSIRLWMVAPNGILNKSHCVAVFERHTSSVGAVCLSSSLMTSASEDGCLKLWSLPKNDTTNWEIQLISTKIAHNKMINAIIINEKESIICTCSADKSAKLWDASNLEFIGTLNHRRGVWHASFYDQKQLIATASADTTIRIWNLDNLECLRIIEVSDSSTFKCCWMNSGHQLISSSGDGVIRIWTIDTSQKKQSVWGGGKLPVALTEHQSRVWTFTVSADENRIISGDADSKIIFWQDATETRLEQQTKDTAQLIHDEQQLANLRQLGYSSQALVLAIKLNRPKDALVSIREMLRNHRDGVNDGLSSSIKQMDMDSKERLLQFVSQWNTRSQDSLTSAEVLSRLLPELSLNKFSKTVTHSSLQSFLAYTKRHHERLTGLLQDLYLLDYTANIMQPNALN